ncbi:hypothetical protein LSTR_LSTR002331 [Laodelphax striatellus]|uniref:Uncharacterized protein n=1 Tax=Laodelphax striatellus TaxID=195883 RepID=A0A482X319_LAOST|nr:hypothetical protein LSTR_LSTR002331 [Laodelphax striatellus]
MMGLLPFRWDNYFIEIINFDYFRILNRGENKVEKRSEKEKLIDSLKAELQLTQGRQQAAEEKVDDLEQYSRRNTIEIHGIPETHNEDYYILLTVAEVAKTIGFDRYISGNDRCMSKVIQGTGHNETGTLQYSGEIREGSRR